MRKLSGPIWGSREGTAARGRWIGSRTGSCSIIDLRGNVIGFGGRIMTDQKPKYLNTSDTMVFNKSQNLYALNFAKNAGEKRLILAEGYMDVIALHQAGFPTAVATLAQA
ncbi:toprim domain-containing protein [[Clostridium] leptum]|uniref:Toprim domain-containing protein n=1 Tax=[Clostridium] leptum TaxID=1535 RepID=A0A412B108_9FIRM|nr:toprim domain-containing protein [[Clostridium] leptum]